MTKDNCTLEEIETEIHEVLADPATTYWFNQAMIAALQRDCVDAATDAEVLARLLRNRATACISAAGRVNR